MSADRPGEVFEALRRAALGGPPLGGAAIIVAHPDDEVIGAGGLLRGLADVKIVHVTDGAPRDERDARAAGFATREAYAAARRRESTEALKLADVEERQLQSLGYVDQEACEHLESITHRISSMLRALAPTCVLTHPYEGGHPDHDAVALAVHAALFRLRRSARSGDESIPPLIEMASYHAREGALVVLDFLPAPSHESFELPVSSFLADPSHESLEVHLSTERRALKARMFERFATQRDVLAAFPVGVERYRMAPPYRFDRPPHDGPLYYEQHPWGMTGARFRQLARLALRNLGMGATTWS